MNNSKPIQNKISLTQQYKMIQAAMTTPIVPDFKRHWNTVFYTMSSEGFQLTTWCEYNAENQTKHRMRVSNKARHTDFPGRFYATGLLARIIHKIVEYRYEHENFEFLVNSKTCKITHPDWFYKKIERDAKSVQPGCSASSLDQQLSKTNMLYTEIDGYRISAKKDTNNETGKAYYRLAISDADASTTIPIYDGIAKKVFMLLDQKRSRIR